MNVSSRSSRELMDQHALSEYGTFLSSDPWDSRDQLSFGREDEDDPAIHYDAESTKTNPSSRLDPTARVFSIPVCSIGAPDSHPVSYQYIPPKLLYRPDRKLSQHCTDDRADCVERYETRRAINYSRHSGHPTSTTVEDRNIRDDDEVSIITQSSTYYSPEQREYVVKDLSLAIIRNLQAVSSPDTADIEISEHVMSHLRSAIKTFAETVEFDQSVREQAKAVRLVRRLRADIARKLHASVLARLFLANIQSTEKKQGLIDIGTKVEEMNLHDIIGHWDPSMAENDRVILDHHDEPEAPTVPKGESSSSSSFTNAIDSSTGSREFVLESRGDLEAVDRTHPDDKAEVL
ncbi:unnamed protein product [Clonostachys byssicola]|uniref:Uncharacterized protein n=1 Tax=Clonostachys byssicola TaxID=160290 RepID=A0A9N9Y0M8_9HYPO|nr:unnamed protein product [Clonostachys byssicola]